jgi:hypothetical protein
MAAQTGRIKDLKTFSDATKQPHEVAGLYFFSVLDCLVDLSHKVAHDFFDRPHLYIDLGTAGSQQAASTIAPVLAKLHARYGTDERVLGSEQRHQIFVALFGPAGGYGLANDSDFARLRNGLVDASAAFAERVYDTGVEMLLERVRSAHRPFREYLRGVTGESVRWSRDEAMAGLTEEVAYPILRNPGISAVFGISKSPRAEWPYLEDANADKMIEQVERQLHRSRLHWEAEIAKPPLTRERISNLQRVALRGAEAIATIIDFDERSTPTDLTKLISACYTWGSALMSVGEVMTSSGPNGSGDRTPLPLPEPVQPA